MARRWPKRRDIITFACVFALLGAVSLLPPDTSLRELQKAGTLRACLPPIYLPMVTGDPAAPGIDVELLRAVAAELGVTLSVVTNPVMGRDFNPRAWRITRAQCDVLAGGVVASPTTRSFLDTTQAYIATGWAWLSPEPIIAFDGQRVDVLVGISGLNRVALGAYLRGVKAEPNIVLDPPELVSALRERRVKVGITERLLARELAAKEGWHSGWMPPSLNRTEFVIGLWKGDLTLKHAIVAAIARLERNGTLPAIRARYLPPGSFAQNDAPDNDGDRRQQPADRAERDQ
jgi:ABC-type amino acid transport substrate-binding protein